MQSALDLESKLAPFDDTYRSTWPLSNGIYFLYIFPVYIPLSFSIYSLYIFRVHISYSISIYSLAYCHSCHDDSPAKWGHWRGILRALCCLPSTWGLPAMTTVQGPGATSSRHPRRAASPTVCLPSGPGHGCGPHKETVSQHAPGPTRAAVSSVRAQVLDRPNGDPGGRGLRASLEGSLHPGCCPALPTLTPAAHQGGWDHRWTTSVCRVM